MRNENNVSVNNNMIKLGEKYKDHFRIGASLAGNEFGFDSLETYPTDLLSEFTSIVAENCMKPDQLQPEKGTFVWTFADRLADFARQKKLAMRGHTLLWHNQTPVWMAPEGDKKTARKNMRDHFEAVMKRYNDVITWWDVVNEAVSDDGGDRTGSMWYQAYGDNTYIIDAFDCAAEYASNAKLFYNDYDIVNDAKRKDVAGIIQELELQKHGLDGVGIQGHWRLDWPDLEEIKKTIDTFYGMGLEVHITELDIDCYNGNRAAAPMEYNQIEEALANRYADIFECFREYSSKISAVIFWGVADDHSWLHTFCDGSSLPYRENFPLLFRKDHQPKKAYYRVIEF